MPRAEAKSSASTASASASPYPSPSASSASSTTSRSSTSSDASSASAAAKKKHVCSQCGRGFTTSGHLARHTRVHTGERNHKCPFPGCETRCSRQDNLQQHYRIHLSPGSRRVSGRALKLKRASQIAQPPMTSPLVLQPATTRSPPPPPNTPPPLEQAPLTALVAESPAASPSSGMLSAGRGHSSSPEGAYPPQYMSASASPATTPSTYGYRTPAYPTSSYDYFSVPAAHHSYVTYAEDCDGRYDVRQAYDPRQVYDDRSWGTGARASSGYDHRASYTDGSSRHSLSYIAPAYRTAEPRRESLPSLASYSGAPSPTSTDSAGSSPTTPAFPYTNNAALVAHGMVAAADHYGKASVSVEQQNVSDYQKAAVAAYPGYAVYDQPSPAYEKHSQTYEQRSPAYDQASPAYDQPSPVYDKPAPAYDQPSPAYEEPAASGVAVPDTRAAIVLPPLEGRAPYQPRTTSAAYTQRIEYMNSDRAQYAPSMDRGLPGMDRVLPAMERGLPPLERGMPAMERAAAYEYGRTGYSHPYDMSWKTEGSTRGRLVGAYAQ